MNALDIIAKKKNGSELSSEEIEGIIGGYTAGAIPDYQMAALLMAICFQGMNRRETVDLAKAMIGSGQKVDLSHIPGRKVDKHSTGGVGDKTSLVVGPIVASCGVTVPMISGRGLGHTGGTLDKLESIPGLRTDLTLDEFVGQLGDIGCAIIGQSDEVVPADQKLYALRDATSTVRSIPLISSSILSKKVAEGTEALLLDVKFGLGAFYPDIKEARKLTKILVEMGEGLGLRVSAVLTDMNQPLGRAVGNWIEVRECVAIMRGFSDADDLLQLCLAEAGLMLIQADKAANLQEAIQMAGEALTSGSAFQKFIEIVQSQGGDTSVLEDPAKLPAEVCNHNIPAPKSGFIYEVNALSIGRAAVLLGAGRLKKEDRIDPGAGIYLHKKCSEKVKKGERLATLYASSNKKISQVIPEVEKAFQIGDKRSDLRPLIVSHITDQGETPWVT